MTFPPLPDRQSWATAAARQPIAPIDLCSIPAPLILKSDILGAAGTLFGRRVMMAIAKAGFKRLKSELPHPALAEIPREAPEYAASPGGYGEIHSARELKQLIQRCDRTFSPSEDRWVDGDRILDAFRPAQLYPARTDQEFEVLRERHLNAVRSGFRRYNLLIVALSSAEVCESRLDGAVFPHPPGTVAGEFDPGRHAFRTLTVDETIADLREAIDHLRGLNPGLKIVLMISPEPQRMTAAPAHVLAASALGKAILRVAMEVVGKMPGVHYCPALEIAGLQSSSADGSPSDALVQDIATTLIALSEGGAAISDADPPISPLSDPTEFLIGGSAPSTPAPAIVSASTPEAKPLPPVAEMPAIKRGKGGRGKHGKHGASMPQAPKIVVAAPVDDYSEALAEQQAKKQRQAKPAPPKAPPEPPKAPAEKAGNDELKAQRAARRAKRAAKGEETTAPATTQTPVAKNKGGGKRGKQGQSPQTPTSGAAMPEGAEAKAKRIAERKRKHAARQAKGPDHGDQAGLASAESGTTTDPAATQGRPNRRGKRGKATKDSAPSE